MDAHSRDPERVVRADALLGKRLSWIEMSRRVPSLVSDIAAIEAEPHPRHPWADDEAARRVLEQHRAGRPLAERRARLPSPRATRREAPHYVATALIDAWRKLARGF